MPPLVDIDDRTMPAAMTMSPHALLLPPAYARIDDYDTAEVEGGGGGNDMLGQSVASVGSTKSELIPEEDATPSPSAESTILARDDERPPTRRPQPHRRRRRGERPGDEKRRPRSRLTAHRRPAIRCPTREGLRSKKTMTTTSRRCHRCPQGRRGRSTAAERFQRGRYLRVGHARQLALVRRRRSDVVVREGGREERP